MNEIQATLRAIEARQAAANTVIVKFRARLDKNAAEAFSWASPVINAAATEAVWADVALQLKCADEGKIFVLGEGDALRSALMSDAGSRTATVREAATLLAAALLDRTVRDARFPVSHGSAVAGQVETAMAVERAEALMFLRAMLEDPLWGLGKR